LDLGTRTGWALLENGRIESGVQVFDVKRGESPGMRYLRFTRWLEEMCWRPTQGKNPALVTVGLVYSDGTVRPPSVPSLIVYEQTHQRGGAATEVAAGFATRVQEHCARITSEHPSVSIEHAAVHSATLKKYATGKGNAKKPDMLRAAQTKLLYEGTDDNEADALWLLHYAQNEVAPR
jgi:hypothetical protein